MSTTKPNRDRPHAEAAYDRKAERRLALVSDIDAVLYAEPKALLDRSAIGFPTDVSFNDSPRGGGDPAESNVVFAAAVAKDAASSWLADKNRVLALLERIADRARAGWRPPDAGTTIAGVTVGARTSTVETCAWCRLPVAGGRDDPLKRVDGDACHAGPGAGHGWCYHAALRSRGKLGKVTQSR